MLCLRLIVSPGMSGEGHGSKPSRAVQEPFKIGALPCSRTGRTIATRNGTSPFNRVYHVVMLAVFIAGLALLPLPMGRAALGRGNREGRGS